MDTALASERKLSASSGGSSGGGGRRRGTGAGMSGGGGGRRGGGGGDSEKKCKASDEEPAATAAGTTVAADKEETVMKPCLAFCVLECVLKSLTASAFSIQEFVLLIPSEFVGSILGRGGSTIKRLQWQVKRHRQMKCTQSWQRCTPMDLWLPPAVSVLSLRSPACLLALVHTRRIRRSGARPVTSCTPGPPAAR